MKVKRLQSWVHWTKKEQRVENKVRGEESECCESSCLQPVGLSRPQTSETPSFQVSASITTTVSFFSIAADRLEGARGKRATMLRTCLHMAINQLHHISIELVKIDGLLVLFDIDVIGLNHLADQTSSLSGQSYWYDCDCSV